jgi:hypothetical protein
MKKKPAPYKGKESAAEERAEARMPMAQKPMGYANGGMVTGMAPNAPTGVCGPGVRGQQDYKK